MGSNLIGDQDAASTGYCTLFICVLHINNESNVQPTCNDFAGL